jgi:CO/xanthine dehydrogenase FAD-binding subunit
MNRFEIVTPADLPSAVRLLAQPGHMALAGGVDTLDHPAALGRAEVAVLGA